MELRTQLKRAGILLAVAATTGAVFTGRPDSADAAKNVAINTPMELGLLAWSEGRLHDADGFLRSAWLVAPNRHTVARRLRELHASRGFRLGIDETAIDETLDLLGDGFRRYETRHFIVLSDCESSWTRNKASILERTRHEFFRFADHLGLPVIPHDSKLLCVLINDYDAYRSFARENDDLDAPWIAGHYAIDANRVVFYNDLTGPAFERAFQTLERYETVADDRRTQANGSSDQVSSYELRQSATALQREADQRRLDLAKQASRFATAKTVHEAVHLLSFNTGVQAPSRAYPLWISEGMASSFETDSTSRAFGPRFPSDAREQTFKRLRDEGRLIAWDRLLRLTKPPAGEAPDVEAIYAQSHMLFSYLARFEPDKLASYMLQVTGDTSKGSEGHSRLFGEVFGPIDEIAARIDRL